ncbi:hypothetical protein RRG08_048001 [Elysia crispata]|uniref:G-protein coupled receptors family 1 profile domain-containing protein n=1 Tax=Elysia crispata TaxID=231223 RepID=A0AAE0XRJ4_9GAST|nr:hypothetical protein RRG08_048001 [Elysia crispata]
MNVSTGLEIVSAPLGEPLISDHITNYVMVMLSLMIMIFSPSATILNILNVFIFINTKLDSVTVCFISLSLSDMSSMVLMSVKASFSLIVASGVSWGRNLPTLSYFLAFIFVLLMDMSSATTTYIAVQRGLCVTFPFITRHMFNKNRSLVICVSISLVNLAFSLPRFGTFRLKTEADPLDNKTTLIVFEYFDSWDSFDKFNLIFMKTILPFTEYGIMFICTVAISIGMRSSMKLKQIPNFYSSKTQCGADSKKSKEKYEKDMDNNEGREKEQTEKKDSKESLVVKQSLIVVLIQRVLEENHSKSGQDFHLACLEISPYFPGFYHIMLKSRGIHDPHLSYHASTVQLHGFDGRCRMRISSRKAPHLTTISGCADRDANLYLDDK